MLRWSGELMALALLVSATDAAYAGGVSVPERYRAAYNHAVCVEVKEQEDECIETLKEYVKALEGQPSSGKLPMIKMHWLYRGWIKGVIRIPCEV